ncbi:E3 ubiquitin-protein ligase BRE1-like 2 isoform X2 [Helianthus annuus]|uniref:E3 ubiquitin-protein ligase BRE1-like 2 isoform X2 n=1 Tax=Helianthus annuus TaxID=4232 RepID=UPI000B8FBD2E|nr:E3 ubiquitin-protein ligase BRE1-like 2 isoform X2 [Helianthus annuus]
METSDSDEPDKKRPHLNNNNNNSDMARHPIPSPENGTVDATVLQYQNQKLVQQLDIQKQKLHDLEDKIKELKQGQTSYDDFLITINQLWNQLDDDLILLGARAGAGQSALEALQRADSTRVPPGPAEEIFLFRLFQTDSIGTNGSEELLDYIKESLLLRHSSTLDLMRLIENTIQILMAKIVSIDQSLHENSSVEDAIFQSNKIDELMKEEVDNLRVVIEALHAKHKEYADMILSYSHTHSVDQSEIKKIAGDLEDSMAELEESRRKLVNLKMQKDRTSVVQTPVPCNINGSISPESTVDKTMGSRDLKDSIEEAKILASDRLSELEEASEDNLSLSKQLNDLQNELKDCKYIYTSRPYTLLSDQLPYWESEVERFRVLVDSLQVERSSVTRKEKELIMKTESINTLRNPVDTVDSTIEKLEQQLQQCINENNESEMKMEEAVQDSVVTERKDIKAEFQVMASALSKEIGMMTSQLNRWKQTGCEAVSLREEAQSLKSLVDKKIIEHKELVDKCSEQSAEIKSLQAHIERLQRDRLETQIFLDMIGQRIYDNRDMIEIKESEQRAHSQAEVLKRAFDEHGLELRIKAAKETEVACQQRLSDAESEIADLSAKLDNSEREVLELAEAIKIKDGEAESYISEIETIGQAYEDMQTQNQHLLQQVMERDDYNIKVVSESVKMKQSHTSLLSEKQTLEKQLQQVNSKVDSLKSRIVHYEEQMNSCITHALKSTEEDRHLAVNLENSKWELSNADKELKCLKSLLSSSEKEYDQIHRKTEEIQEELDNERMDRKKLDEELEELNMKITELTLGSGEAAIQKLEDEIKDCKSILKCGVCFDRPKEVVIVKCYHLFCNPCIQRNLEIRHRKCPGCGMAFGQNDVRFVKI